MADLFYDGSGDNHCFASNVFHTASHLAGGAVRLRVEEHFHGPWIALSGE